MAGDPVHVGTGNFLYEKEDLYIPGAADLCFARTYNALDSEKGVMGRGWRHSYEQHIQWNPDRTKGILELPDGKRTPIERKSNQLFYRYEGEDGVLRSFSASGLCLWQENPAGGRIYFRYDKDRKLESAASVSGMLRYHYGETGRLVCVEDHTGRRVELTYERGRLSEITGPGDDKLKYFYGENNRLEYVEDGEGNCLVRNQYDKRRRIIRQDMPGGQSLEFSYDGRGMTTMWDGEGKIQKIRTDASARILSRKGQRLEEQYFYDKEGRLTGFRDEEGKRISCTYNELGYPEKSIFTDGTQEQFCYSKNGMENIRIRRDGSLVTDYFDQKGRLCARVNGNGERLGIMWGDNNMISGFERPDGKLDELAYDAKGNLVAVKISGSEEHYFQYDRLNRMICHQLPDESRTEYEYDEQNRLISVRERTGEKMRITYGASGMPVCIEKQNGSWEKFEWSRLGQLTGRADADGTKEEYRYDKAGRLTGILYENIAGKEEVDIYYDGELDSERNNHKASRNQLILDKGGRLVRMQMKNGEQFVFRRDLCGELISIEQDGTEQLQIKRDACGRPALIKRKQKEMYMEWDSEGRLLYIRDGKGNFEKNLYDICGNLKETIRSDGEHIQYTCDECGRVIYKRRKGEQRQYTYDAAGYMIRETDGAGRSRSYEYNGSGQCTAQTDSRGNRTEYGYNSLGQLHSVKDALGNTICYQYDSWGGVSNVEGTAPLSGRIPGYIPPEDIWQETDRQEEGCLTEEKDDIGRIIAREYAAGLRQEYRYGSCGEMTVCINYDKDGELDRFFYWWDGEGNLTAVKVWRRGLPDECGHYEYEYEYDVLNRLETIRKNGKLLRKYIYDSAGNRTKMEEYREDGRLRGIEKWEYDSKGRLIRYEGIEKVSFYKYDKKGNMMLIEERVNQSTDGRCIPQQGESGEIFLYDYLGSPKRRYSSDGKLLESYSCDEFGRTVTYDRQGRKRPGSGTIHGYAGYCALPDGTLQAGIRIYDPCLGRFLSEDPATGQLEDMQTQNPYTYVYNRPFSYVDRSGAWGKRIAAAPAGGDRKITEGINRKQYQAFRQSAGAGGSLWHGLKKKGCNRIYRYESGTDPKAELYQMVCVGNNTDSFIEESHVNEKSREQFQFIMEFIAGIIDPIDENSRRNRQLIYLTMLALCKTRFGGERENPAVQSVFATWKIAEEVRRERQRQIQKNNLIYEYPAEAGMSGTMPYAAALQEKETEWTGIPYAAVGQVEGKCHGKGEAEMEAFQEIVNILYSYGVGIATEVVYISAVVLGDLLTDMLWLTNPFRPRDMWIDPIKAQQEVREIAQKCDQRVIEGLNQRAALNDNVVYAGKLTTDLSSTVGGLLLTIQGIATGVAGVEVKVVETVGSGGILVVEPVSIAAIGEGILSVIFGTRVIMEGADRFIDNLWKMSESGRNTVNTLTDAQKSRLNSLENTINDHLTEGDFSGTLRDLQGDPVPNGKGGYFDHLGEMKDSYSSLKKIKKGLEGSLKNPNLSDVDRALLQEGLDKANLYIKRIQEMFKPYGGIE